MKKTVADKNGGHDVELSQEEEQKKTDEWNNNENKYLILLKISTRKDLYGTYDQQLELMYQDKINGTENWKNYRKSVDDAIPLDNSPLSQEDIATLSANLNIVDVSTNLNIGLL